MRLAHSFESKVSGFRPVKHFFTAASFAIALSACDSLTLTDTNETDDLYDGTYDHLLIDSDSTQSRAASVLLGRKDAAYFANQASFGSTITLIKDIQKNGREGWINQQFSSQLGQSHVAKMEATDTNDRLDEDRVNDQFGSLVGGEWIVPQMWKTWIEEPDQLRLRVAAALMEMFVVTARVDAIGIKRNQYTAAAFVDLLEKHAFGNYGDLLYDVSRHPAMAHYLSFIDNEKAEYDTDGKVIRVPDENYAREILQLFSIGLYELNLNGSLKTAANGKAIETYDQEDIFNLARVFTGWTRDVSIDTKALQFTKPLVQNPQWHSPEAKNFLGLNIRANTSGEHSLRLAIDHIFKHANVAPFVSKQLIQRLIKSNPSPAYVERVAKVFVNNGSGVRGDMKSVISAIYLDQEASNRNAAVKDTKGAKLREPMFRLTAIARLLDDTSALGHYTITDLSDTSHGLGQSPLKSPSVFNFYRPGYTPPGSELANAGLVAPEFQIVNGSAIPGSINLINEYIATADKRLMNRKWNRKLTKAANNPKKLVNLVSLVLTANTINNGERKKLVVPLEATTDSTQRVRSAVQLVSSHPEFLIQR